MARRRRFCASVALLVGLGALNAFVPARGVFAEPFDEFDEAAAAALQAQADEAGALGIFYDDATGEAVVVFAADRTLSFAPTGAAATVRARLETRNISAAQIRAIENGLLSLATTKKLSLGAYFDPRLGKIVIQTESPAAMFSPMLSAFSEMTEFLNSPVVRYSRDNDGAPHWGGAKIVSAGFDPCSSGFTVKNSAGTRYMVTAGHCFPNGAIVKSGGGLAFGTIVQRAEYPTYDMELIGGSTYAGRIYNADDCCTSAQVAGASDPVVGRAIYCHSGFFSLSGCGETVTDLHALFCTGGQCTPDTMKFDAPDPPGPGDSGGPFYLPGSAVYIRGMVIGGGVLSCPCYGEKWSSISGKFSVSIYTGG